MAQKAAEVPASQAADMGGLRSDMGPASRQDPTPLTTQQLLRENFWLRELLEERITGVEARITASDKALTLLQQFADRTPTTKDVEAKVDALRELTMEMFRGVKDQFVQLAIQMDKAARDVKSAVDAAFAAAKEAVGEQNKSNALSIDKSEKSVANLISALNDQIKTIVTGMDDKFNDVRKGIDDKFNDVKERVLVIESKTSVSDPTTAINLAKLEALVTNLKTQTDKGEGNVKGQGQMAGWIAAGIMGLVSIGMLTVDLIALRGR